jgi:cytosine/adenosine deaminase-related metal-dependent hydrolase
LWEWFSRVVDPAGQVLEREDLRVGTRLRAAEMLLCGTTTVNDMTCHRNIGALASLGAVEGLRDMGLRGIVCFGAENVWERGAPPREEAFMEEHEALHEHLRGDPLLGYRCGVGTVLGVTERLMRMTVAACRERGWAVHTHLQEIREEVTMSRIGNGAGTIAYAAAQGLLDRPTIAGHCVWLTERDIATLREKRVAVAHLPVANMLLGSGIAPVPRLLGEGLVVALGTDGAASNDNQDMFGLMKAAGLIHKLGALDAQAIDARDVLRMATVGGARALGLDGQVGSLEPGKRADVVLLDGNTPELHALHDPWQAIVYAATPRCVSHVWVDGRPRVRDGSLVAVELAELAHEARARAVALARRGGLSDSRYVRAIEEVPA